MNSVLPPLAPPPTHGIIPLGMRNNTRSLRPRTGIDVDDFNGLLDVVETRNMDELPSGTEVIRAARSAWRYEQEGRNLMKRGRAVVIAHDVVDGLMHEDPDAFLLLIHLRRRHWGRNFVIANAMTGGMPGGGGPFDCSKRLDPVCQIGLVQQLRPATHRKPAMWRFADFRPPQSRGSKQRDVYFSSASVFAYPTWRLDSSACLAEYSRSEGLVRVTAMSTA